MSALTGAIARCPLLIATVWLALIVGGFGLGERVKYDPDVLVYFDKSYPERVAFDQIVERFGQNQEVVTLAVPRSGDAFTPAGLQVLAALENASLSRPEVAAVRSPLSLIDVTADEVIAADQAELIALAEALRRRAADPGIAPLIDPAGSVVAVAAILPAQNNNENAIELAAEHAALRDALVPDHPGFDLIQTGRLIIDAAFLNESRDDLDQFAGTQVILLVSLLFLAFGSISLTIVASLIALGIIGLTVGAIGALGIQLNGISSASPAVLMGIGLASAVHLGCGWQAAIRAGADRREALVVALRRNGGPIALSLLTTLLSFLVLNVAEAPPFRDLGNIVAVGLIGVALLVFLMMPAMLLIIPRSTGAHRRHFENALSALTVGIARRRIVMLCGTAAAVGIAIAGMLAIVVDDTFSHYFDETYEVRRATDLFEERLSGTTINDAMIDSGRAGGVTDPEFLTRLVSAVTWLEQRPEVARTDSAVALLDVVPAGAPLAIALPAAAEAAATQGRPLLIDDSGRYARISIVMRGVSSQDTLRFTEDAHAALTTIMDAPVDLTGMPILSAKLSIGSGRSMIVGMVLALVSISVIIAIALRDWRLGVLSIVPNVLPVALAFGLWGALVGEISFAATVVAALTYGIVVDDTVHILARYRRSTAAGFDWEESVRRTYSSVGVAVVVTTLTLALSFLPFALSGFLVNRHFGALTALTLLFALVADILFLPALLAARRRQKER